MSTSDVHVGRLIGPPGSLSGRAMGLLTAGGLLLGVAYTLSPLSVWTAVAALLLGRALVRGLEGTERRVLLAIFVAALVLRVLVLAGLFLSVDHGATPFGSLFGDEEYFKRRSLWLRSMALGVNVSEADRTYALDEYSETSYLYLLAFVQMLVGDAPYGVHLFSMVAYLGAAVWMFRFTRRVFGPAPAALTFGAILFLPTLFLWSVSALRESVHFLLTLAPIAGVTDALTRARWRDRLIGVVAAAVALYALRDLRQGSMAVMAVSVVAGTTAALAVVTWRRLVLVVIVGSLAAGVVLSRPSVQERLLTTVRSMALSHQGHAFTPGVHYKVLEPRFYRERALNVMDDMTAWEAGRYVFRAMVAAIVVPLPWHAETRLLQAYLPEHMLWLLMCLLLPVGVWAAARRHPAASFIMASYIAVMLTGVALRSGNVGTLVRHRGLVLPFMIVLSAVAVCHLLARLSLRSPALRLSPFEKGPSPHGAD